MPNNDSSTSRPWQLGRRSPSSAYPLAIAKVGLGPGPKRQQGFSLLEILVAFSIMAISLGILLQIFSSGVNTAVIAEEYTVATQIAEGLMATTGVETPLTVGDREGVEEDKYRWRVSISELAPLPDVEQSEAVLLNVNVTVQWGSAARQIELNTIKAGTSS